MRSKADSVTIAADNPRVEQAVKAFGGNVVMTKPSHPSGSDRVWEAAQSNDAELIVNVQGDEPFLPHEVIDHFSCPMGRAFISWLFSNDMMRSTFS